jgi:hypothetical protein
LDAKCGPGDESFRDSLSAQAGRRVRVAVVAGATDDLYAKQIADWKEQSEQLGASAEEWEDWMRHQDDHDYHATLIDQIDWLREAKFKSIDCTWRFILWTVLQAQK